MPNSPLLANGKVDSSENQSQRVKPSDPRWTTKIGYIGGSVSLVVLAVYLVGCSTRWRPCKAMYRGIHEAVTHKQRDMQLAIIRKNLPPFDKQKLLNELQAAGITLADLEKASVDIKIAIDRKTGNSMGIIDDRSSVREVSPTTWLGNGRQATGDDLGGGAEGLGAQGGGAEGWGDPAGGGGGAKEWAAGANGADKKGVKWDGAENVVWNASWPGTSRGQTTWTQGLLGTGDMSDRSAAADGGAEGQSPGGAEGYDGDVVGGKRSGEVETSASAGTNSPDDGWMTVAETAATDTGGATSDGEGFSSGPDYTSGTDTGDMSGYDTDTATETKPLLKL